MPDIPKPSRRDLWIHWLVYPGHSLPTAAAPVLVAMGLAIHDHVFAFFPALIGFVASWLIHIGGLFADNYQLVVQHPTVNEHPELLKALEDGSLSLQAMRWAIIACFTLAALTGPYLVHVAGTPVIAIGLLGMAGSLGYSAGPFPFGKHGLSDVHFFIMFGVFAPAAAYFVQLASHSDVSSSSISCCTICRYDPSLSDCRSVRLPSISSSLMTSGIATLMRLKAGVPGRFGSVFAGAVLSTFCCWLLHTSSRSGFG